MPRLPKVRHIYATTDELMLAAEEGNAQAQNEMATAYATGNGVQQDRHKAFQWWKKAAEGGDPVAMERLADIFRTGEVMSQKVTHIDLDAAVDWYRKASVAGNHDALFGLAVVYQLRQEFHKAAETFRLSAYTYGKRESLREYGMMMFHGNGIDRDADKAREIIAEAALMDQEFSDLGCAYLAQNYGVKLDMPKNEDERLQRRHRLDQFQFGCLLKRAEGGDTDAQVEIAHKYIFGGKQVEMNRDKAYFWFRRAAEAGDAEAQYEMGRASEAGSTGIGKDPEGAFKWYKKSAEQMHVDGLREAGRCLCLGEGTDADHKQAAKYLERAAKMCDPESMVFFGWMLKEGQGVKKDAERGQQLIDRALEVDRNGIGLARLRLAMLEGEDGASAGKKKRK